MHRLACPVLAMSLLCPAGALLPATASAGPAAPASPGAADEAALEEARAMFERGRAKYDTFDYGGAIDLWQQAYAKVPQSQAGVRNAMVYNIALAQEKAFDLDHDVAHLRQAVLLLESWLASYKAMFKKTPETTAEAEKAQARIAELKARIAGIESGQETTTVEPAPLDPSGSTIAFDTGYNPPPEVRKERQKARAANESEGLIAAGWTVAGIGGLITLGGAAALAAASDSTAGRGGGGAALGVGLAMLAAGGVLLGVGYKKKKEVQSGNYTFAPYGSPNGAGATFRMRF